MFYEFWQDGLGVTKCNSAPSYCRPRADLPAMVFDAISRGWGTEPNEQCCLIRKRSFLLLINIKSFHHHGAVFYSQCFYPGFVRILFDDPV